MKQLTYLLCLLLIYTKTFSQSYEGRVIDEWGKNLEGVKIGVNGIFINSDANGSFSFKLKDKEKISKVSAEKKPYYLGKWEQDGNFLFVVMASPLKLIDGHVSTELLKPVVNAKIEIYGLKESFPTYSNKEGDFRLRVPFYYKVNADTRFLVDGYEIRNDDYAFSEKDLFLRITRTESQNLLVRQEPQVPTSVRAETKRQYTKGIKLNLYGKNYTIENQSLLKIFESENKEFSVESDEVLQKDGFIYINFLHLKNKDSLSKSKILYSDDLQIPANPKEAVASMMRSENKGTLISNEVIRISKLISTARIDSIKRSHLQVYLEHLETALFSTDTSYQNSMEKAKKELLKLKTTVSEKDAAAKIDEQKYEQIKREKEAVERQSRRNILVSSGVVLFFIALTYASIRVAQNIRKQRNELGRVNRKLEVTTEDLTEKINFIETQKEEINKQALSVHILNEQLSRNNKKMMDSIRYAHTIQDSVLPTTETLTTLFRDCFVIYKPKDIVSGDFYWLAYVPQKDKEFIFLAVIDCTGHGVSGAFMSMIGNALLNEIINKKKIYVTASILEEMDRGIREVLRQNETANDDGMDVCLCKFIQNFEETKVIFTGAKRPLFHHKESENRINILKGDARSLGGGKKNKKKRDFAEQKLYLKAGDTLYLTTDGFIDQANENNEKFGTQRFIETLHEIAYLSMPEQQQILEKSLLEHQQTAEQRDDISLIGIRI